MFSSENWFGASPSFYNGVATQSLRFNDDDDAYLSRTPSSASNRKTWTYSTWFKIANTSASQTLFSGGSSATGRVALYMSGGQFITDLGGTGTYDQSTALFRDPSAWYHLVWAFDTTQGTGANRSRIYINGTEITLTKTRTWSSNTNYAINNNTLHVIGGFANAPIAFSSDAYHAETNFVDGSQLTPSPFGETKNGVWIPIEYTGSYGTNGFRLQFNQTGVGTASASTIGADTSGNTHHFSSSGIVASDCNMPDSPENNFATLNPLWNSVQQTYAEGNLKTTSGSSHSPTCSTIGVSSGKWYVEGVALSSSSTKWSSGIFDTAITYNKVSGTNYIPGQSPTNIYANGDGINYYASGNDIYKNGSQVISNAFSSALTTDDIIQIAFDVDNGKIWYGINNSWNNGTSTQGSFDLSNHDTTFTVQQEMRVHFTGESNNWIANFGQDSSFAGNETAQGNTDAKGIGDFYYAPPSGFLALCTSNLPEPTISPNATTQADDYFNTVLFTGNGGTKSVTGLGFQPDLFWGKSRTNPSGVYSHSVYDSSRGVTKRLLPDLLNDESTASGITSFDADGFTLGSNAGNNNNNSTYVNWCWKANGGTTSTNDDGSIQSTVQANTTSGFSIVQYVATGSNATVGHGLSVEPDTVWIKNRDTDSRHWMSYWRPLGGTDRMLFNDLATASTSTSFNNTSPTSTVFSIGTSAHVNDTSDNYIAYCFASVEGYSKIGSYTGNGSTDGTFVYTGFRPAWILYKNADSSGDWELTDTTRNPENDGSLLKLEPNNTGIDSARVMDILSNGFKFRNGNSNGNTTHTYIYISFAENPYKYSLAR